MITVSKSLRNYCISCCDREPVQAYEIRFGNPKFTNTSVMTICEVCLLQMKKAIRELSPSE
ncbi:hypothetical protein PAV_141p00440 (plasmid) [Paenibacillus alvei DSM 29]|nr:hypothetical protein PAV_141p00440 [Paenibacillus alvei DSM 29]